MFIGQCGMPKSGNYLLYRILREILQQLGSWSSYSGKTRCWDSLFQLNDDIPLMFPEQRDIDEVYIKDGLIFLYNGHLNASFAIRNIEEFKYTSRLIWTHQVPMLEHHKLLGSERRWFYILRDGRDVINSWAHNVVSPDMRRRNPQYRISRVEDLYQRYDLFEKTVKRWASHVQAYLKLRNYYLEIRYENLVKEKVSEIKRIADYLGISIPDVNAIMKKTSVEATRLHAPLHVRRARVGDWRVYFTSRHKQIFKKIAGSLLKELGYTEDDNW